MLEFNDVEELRDCKELQNMARYQYKVVKLEGKEAIVCPTNQQYEDIIWGGIQNILEEIDDVYKTNVSSGDLAALTRDFILNSLEDGYGVRFVDVFDEY